MGHLVLKYNFTLVDMQIQRFIRLWTLIKLVNIFWHIHKHAFVYLAYTHIKDVFMKIELMKNMIIYLPMQKHAYMLYKVKFRAGKCT